MARRRTYRTRAIVLDKTRLAETDLILTLLAEDGRQIRAIAKGARRPGGRLAARCELACDVDLLLACGRSLDIVSEARMIASPLGAAPDLPVLAAASALTEVAKLNCFEDAEDPFIFPITRCALDVAAAAGRRARSASGGVAPASDPLVAAHLDLIVAAYVFKLMSHMGYRPDCTACVLCGDTDLTYFSAAAGGLLCSSCAASVTSAEPIDADRIGWLRALIALRFSELATSPIDAPAAAVMLSLAHTWAVTHLDSRLRSLEFMLGR
ncbi:DNA replication and repair protein RecO [Coriobacterium glomerans PW2]|uniref:DNA repair protein RecO n=1 Tax=Coriobacterium glomerans (strain ATCC 49209 / DSM 20642 / JCM 10262 / PW2) TaxID=700015 RepID=F2N7Q7_CORGP|nr:DNA repair protein RecO C-terminal domain-containing protein [Coriobacterium glomerans]AEB06949.1 DNA replication and repair protein RecO [Coriobacterium glomerans PW2]